MAAARSPRVQDGENLMGERNKGEEVEEDQHLLLQQQLSILEKLSISPSTCKKLLILDLNGLLAHTFFRTDGNVRVPKSRRPDAILGSRKYVFKRPFCDEFLHFCFERFDVAIWSSAMRRNVEGVIKCVMGDFADRLLFIYDQTDCTDTGLKTLENRHKPLFLKELRKVWDEDTNYGHVQGRRRQFSPSNTLLIDDSPHKALLNPPFTAIFPHPYMVDCTDDASLGQGGELRMFLEGIAAADVDVPSYVGSHPLGQQPITAEDRHWDFYSQVIGRVQNITMRVHASQRPTVRKKAMV